MLKLCTHQVCSTVKVAQAETQCSGCVGDANCVIYKHEHEHADALAYACVYEFILWGAFEHTDDSETQTDIVVTGDIIPFDLCLLLFLFTFCIIESVHDQNGTHTCSCMK